MTKSLQEVTSTLYLISPFDGYSYDPDNLTTLLTESPYDLIVYGNIELPENYLKRFSFDDKIVIGYIDIAESTGLVTENYTGGIQDYFGKLHTAFEGLHTVKYWDPRWWEVIKFQIDNQIAAGYDGIFIDVVDGHLRWSESNTFGNPIVPDAAEKMKELVQRIRDYVDSKNLDRPFYLMGNNSATLAREVGTDVLDIFDASLSEGLIWMHSQSTNTVAVKNDVSFYNSQLEIQSEIYNGRQTFGLNYPTLDNPTEIIESIRLQIEHNWSPGVQKPVQDRNILFDGPFVAAANQYKTTVTGDDQGVNYLTELKGVNSTLIGNENAINYYIINDGDARVISAGSNNIVYMRPETVYGMGLAKITLTNTLKGQTTTPYIDYIKVNDITVLENYSIDAVWGQNQQTVTLNLTEPVENLVIAIDGVSYSDQENLSNTVFYGIEVDGKNIDLSLADISSGQSLPGYTFSNNGTVTFTKEDFVNTQINTSRVRVDSEDSFTNAIYEADRDNFVITYLSNGGFSVSSDRFKISDYLNDVERLVFDDTTVALDIEGVAGQAYRIYKAAFDRAPDLAGLGYWIDAMDNGAQLTGVAGGFIGSNEFQSRYGSTVSNEDFATLLYNNVLDRDPDLAGLEFWVNGLNNGATRESVLIGFSESIENVNNLMPMISNGIEYIPFVP